MAGSEYDPFAAGQNEVAVRTIEANDAARDRRFPVEIWCPAVAEAKPLIVFSHYSGGHRWTATYLCQVKRTRHVGVRLPVTVEHVTGYA